MAKPRDYKDEYASRIQYHLQKAAREGTAFSLSSARGHKEVARFTPTLAQIDEYRTARIKAGKPDVLPRHIKLSESTIREAKRSGLNYSDMHHIIDVKGGGVQGTQSLKGILKNARRKAMRDYPGDEPEDHIGDVIRGWYELSESV